MREQLSEMTRTADEYCSTIAKKAEQVDTLTNQLGALKTQYDNACSEIITYEGQLREALQMKEVGIRFSVGFRFSVKNLPECRAATIGGFERTSST